MTIHFKISCANYSFAVLVKYSSIEYAVRWVLCTALIICCLSNWLIARSASSRSVTAVHHRNLTCRVCFICANKWQLYFVILLLTGQKASPSVINNLSHSFKTAHHCYYCTSKQTLLSQKSHTTKYYAQLFNISETDCEAVSNVDMMWGGGENTFFYFCILPHAPLFYLSLHTTSYR